jgi:hypothetical protein
MMAPDQDHYMTWVTVINVYISCLTRSSCSRKHTRGRLCFPLLLDTKMHQPQRCYKYIDTAV